MEKVRNLNGTSEHACPVCGSWLKHWANLSEKEIDDCAACTKKATVGAHVQKAYGEDKQWYIIPLCDECNKKSSDEVFIVYDELVPAVKCRPEKK